MNAAATAFPSWSKNDQCALGANWSNNDHSSLFGYHHHWSNNDQSAPRAHWSENDQKDTMMVERLELTPESLLVRLMHALNDRDSAYLLWYLLAQRADLNPLRTSRRAIHADLGGTVGLTNVLTATNRLVESGLISTRVYPRTFTEYRVMDHAVAELLVRQPPAANFLPGLKPREVPFVTRWNSGESFIEVPNAAGGENRFDAVDQSDNLSDTEIQHDQ